MSKLLNKSLLSVLLTELTTLTPNLLSDILQETKPLSYSIVYLTFRYESKIGQLSRRTNDLSE